MEHEYRFTRSQLVAIFKRWNEHAGSGDWSYQTDAEGAADAQAGHMLKIARDLQEEART